MWGERQKKILQDSGSTAENDTAPKTAAATQNQFPLFVGGEMGVNRATIRSGAETYHAALETAPAPQHKCPMLVGGKMGVNSTRQRF